jgi:hypothetical protein
VSGGEGGGAANGATNQIASVIQTVLAAQLVAKGGMLGESDASARGGTDTSERDGAKAPASPAASKSGVLPPPGAVPPIGRR